MKDFSREEILKTNKQRNNYLNKNLIVQIFLISKHLFKKLFYNLIANNFIINNLIVLYFVGLQVKSKKARGLLKNRLCLLKVKYSACPKIVKTICFCLKCTYVNNILVYFGFILFIFSNHLSARAKPCYKPRMYYSEVFTIQNKIRLFHSHIIKGSCRTFFLNTIWRRRKFFHVCLCWK